MRVDQFTVKAQQAVQDAHSIAVEREHGEIAPLHLLLALMNQEGGIAQPIVEKVGVAPARVRQIVEAELKRLPRVTGAGVEGERNPGRALMAVFERALKATKTLKDKYVSTEHLVLALAESKGDPAGDVLATLGVTPA